jgi:hypothetical protein
MINLDKDKIKIGESIKVTLEYKDELKSLKKDLLLENGIMILTEPILKDGFLTFEITSYKRGQIELPFYKTKIIEVNNDLKAEELIDIKGPQNISLPFYYNFYYIIPVVLVIIIAYFLLKFFKRKKIKDDFKIPSYDKAIQCLEKIKEEKLYLKDKKLFVSLVSEVFNRFLEEEYSISIMEKTSTEFLQYLKKKELFDYQVVLDIKKYLLYADYVKYKKEGEEVFESFLDETKEKIKLTRKLI